jgi:hypothetical protein
MHMRARTEAVARELAEGRLRVEPGKADMLRAQNDFFRKDLPMNVQIVVFPETKVAAIEHFGSPDLEHSTGRKLIAWKLEQSLILARLIPWTPAKQR